ncbi:MAG: dihydrolipoyl dehydrogenase [Candidatus Cloacimonetes bacterium]|nr:dihydrolipoyl dehydrogenase [Candidatus Cloacimonadota bacterium]MDY0367336.1 dihydrolipoyl dehydrogenase [Candidatus Syntrophosphaera sp.]
MPEHKVLIIGGGPGGYETAIRLNQYGIDCAVLEMERLGGVCLNWGCIPTKALVKSSELFTEIKNAAEYGLPPVDPELDYARVFARKNAVVEQLVSGVEHLFRKRAIPVLREKAISVSALDKGYEVHTEAGTSIRAEYLVLATGSVPKELPGVKIDEVNVLSSTGILALETLPQSLAIVGGGVIGCEFASIMNSFGVQTTIIEFLPRILALEDEEIGKRLTLALKKSGIKIVTGVGVENVLQTATGNELTLSDGSKMTVDKVLLSVGRVPRCDLDWQSGAPKTERGAVTIDTFMRSSLPGVYAIGDLTAKLPLAHTASKQGMTVAAHIRALSEGRECTAPALNYANIPRCTFTHPELASVGYTEAEAREKFGAVKVGKLPYSANGKALAMSGTYGLVKTIAREDDDSLVGMHILGLNAAELIAQGALLLSLGAKADVAEKVTFAHPTLSETIKESLEDLHNLAINKI